MGASRTMYLMGFVDPRGEGPFVERGNALVVAVVVVTVIAMLLL